MRFVRRSGRKFWLAALPILLWCALSSTGLPAPAQAEARRLPADQVGSHLLSVADREWRDWGQPLVDARDGHSRVLRRGARESDRAWSPDPAACTPARRARRSFGCHHEAPFDAQLRVRQYWRVGLGPDSKPAREPAELERLARAAPWSAVFISFLMEQVGLSRDAFPFDEAHSNYLRGLAAREAGLAARDAPAQFAVLLARDTPLAPGDLLCGPRNTSRDLDRYSVQVMRSLDDLQRLTASHCDLVVTVDRRTREARLIGGNVANSVAMTVIPLTSDGRAIRTLTRPWFAIARPR
jgi:hypothetical protein